MAQLTRTFPVLEGKVAIVTGAAMGMGEATARLFADAGAKVVVADFSEALGAKVAESIAANEHEAAFVKVDISKSDQVNGALEAMFYSYVYPEPDGFRSAAVKPAAARFDAGLGEFLLPYAAVQASEDPEATLLAFLQSTYEAAAETGRWDRAALECALGRPKIPRPLSGASSR